MADTTEHGPGHSTTTGGISRAISAPVRAVTRIFTPAANASTLRSRPVGNAVVDCGFYIHGVRQPGEWGHAQALAAAQKRDDAFVWLGLHEPTAADLDEIAGIFELEAFSVEDAVEGGQRPKLEPDGDRTFLVVRTARYVPHAEITENSEIVETGDLMMFVGPNFIITVRHGELNALGPIRTELDQQQDLLALGPWAVVYSILDKVVDSYVEVADRVETDIDAIESHVFSRNTHSRIARIYQLKRELVEFKRSVVPLQRPLSALVEGRCSGMPSDVTRYFRDVHDHLVRTVEQIVSYDDLLNSVLQARLAQVTVEQNNDMRKIASWAAIAAMQTAIAGIYGMNFYNMPELHWKYGYAGVLLVMFGSAVALYRLFRRSGWL
jgi:magnesium transporter